jgi:phage-related protein (TIGR01555 family)
MQFNQDSFKDTQEDIKNFQRLSQNPPKFSTTDIYNYYNYRSGLFHNIINIIAKESISKGIIIEDENKELFEKELKNINFINQMQKIGILTRLFGMSLVYLDINDGQYLPSGSIDISTEVNFNNITDFKIKYIFPAGKFQPLLENGDYLDWQYYNIYKEFDFNQEPQFKIHKSRVILVKNFALYDDYLNSFNNNNLSEIYRCFEAVEDYHNLKDLIINLTEQSVFDVVKFNLNERLNGLTSNENIKTQIKDALNIIKESKKNNKIIALKEGDEFQRIQNTITGFEGMLEQIKEFIAGVSKIPIKKLFGSKNTGLANSGQESLENYYKELKSFQENILFNPISYILKIIAFKNKKPVPSFVFNSLFEIDENEMIQIETAKANIRKIDIESGFKTIDEVRADYGLDNDPLSNLDSLSLNKKKHTFFSKIKNVFK